MTKLNRNLIAGVVGITVAFIGWLLLWPANLFLRPFLGVLLILALPGFALGVALFPGKQIDIVERLTIGVGLAVTLVILLGFGLDATSEGLNSLSWVLATSGAVGVVAAIAWRRRPALAVLVPIRVRTIRPFGWFVVAAGFMLGAWWVARIGAQSQTYPGFTQFWMLPASVDGDRTVRIGVRNFEGLPLQFEVHVVVEDQVYRSWSQITLQSSETWEAELILPPVQPQPKVIYARLYRRDQPGIVYREVDIWR